MISGRKGSPILQALKRRADSEELELRLMGNALADEHEAAMLEEERRGVVVDGVGEAGGGRGGSLSECCATGGARVGVGRL